MSDANGTLVRVEKVSKTFKRGAEEIHVLDGLDLSLQKGEFLALMGPSGSGKSTLLNIIGGPRLPDCGGGLGRRRANRSPLREEARGLESPAHRAGLPVL